MKNNPKATCCFYLPDQNIAPFFESFIFYEIRRWIWVCPELISAANVFLDSKI